MISFEENNKTFNISQWDKYLVVVLHLESYVKIVKEKDNWIHKKNPHPKRRNRNKPKINRLHGLCRSEFYRVCKKKQITKYNKNLA